MNGRQSEASDVRAYFDQESPHYLDERYCRTGCDQLSYQNRRRLALEFLGSGPGRLIDIGSGPGVLSGDVVARGFTLYEVDFALEMLRESRRRLQQSQGRARVSFIEAQLPTLPFAEASFDAATCIGVFAYLADPAPSLREIRRILKPGGVLVMQVSNALCPAARLHSVLRRAYRRVAETLGGRRYPHLRMRLASFRLPPLRRILQRERFYVDSWAHYDFRPPLLEWIAPSAALRTATWCQRFERSSVGLIAEGIVLRARAC